MDRTEDGLRMSSPSHSETASEVRFMQKSWKSAAVGGSVSRYRAILRCREDGLTILEDGKALCVNDSLCEMFGYSRHEMLGLSELALAAPEEKERLRQLIKDARQKGRAPRKLEYWAVRKDGDRRYIRSQYSGSYGEGMVPLRMVVTSDITEQWAEQQSAGRGPDQPEEVSVDEPKSWVESADSDDLVTGDLTDSVEQPLKAVSPHEGAESDESETAAGLSSGTAQRSDEVLLNAGPRAWIQIDGEWRLFSMTEVPAEESPTVAGEDEASGLDRTGLLCSTSKALVTAGDPEEMLSAICQPAVQAGAHAASLLYIDVDSKGQPEWAEVVAAIGEMTLAVGTRVYLPDSPLTGLLLTSPDRPLMVADVDVPDVGVNEAIVHMMKSVPAQAFAVLPLRVGQRWNGMILIAWPEPHEFDSEEERLYGLLGCQLASLVQGQRMDATAQHRAMWSQTAAEVSQAAATVLDSDELFQRVVTLVHDRFGLYYAGLFLVEEVPGEVENQDRWATLRVGTGEAGRQMVGQGHRLRVGGASMIGQCLATMEPRIAMDVGKEAVRFDNPWLPDTRTELALPLVSRGRALGALSIQSSRPAAFSSQDVVVLQSMADQLSIAIDNAHLMEKAQSRAEREQRVRKITERIRRGADTESIMRIALEELSQMVGANKAIVRLGTQSQLGAGAGESPLLPD
jgi:PAS domain S-box-containing protein